MKSVGFVKSGRRALAAALLVALVLAGCGDGSETPETPPDEPSTDDPETPPDDAETPDDSDTPTDADGTLEPVTFRLDWIITGEHAHFYAALENGYFAEEGLAVEILEGAGSALALQQVSNKGDDFGLAGFDALAQSKADGLPAVMIANIFRRSPHVVLSLESNGITSAEDLVGKQIGAAAGGSPFLMFSAFLEAAGIDEGDVEIVSLDPASYIPALLEGRIDGFLGFAPSQLPILTASAPEPVSTLFYADAGVVTVSTGLIAHPDTIAERPDVVAGFVRAVQRGLQWTIDNPDEAVEIMANRFPRSVNPDEAILAVEQVARLAYGERTADAPLGEMNEEDAVQTLDTLQQFADLDEILPLEEYYTNEFVDTSF